MCGGPRGAKREQLLGGLHKRRQNVKPGKLLTLAAVCSLPSVLLHRAPAVIQYPAAAVDMQPCVCAVEMYGGRRAKVEAFADVDPHSLRPWSLCLRWRQTEMLPEVPRQTTQALQAETETRSAGDRRRSIIDQPILYPVKP